MEPDMPSRVSVDSVMSILSAYSDEGPKDRDLTRRLLRDARAAIHSYVKGSLVKGHRIAADGILLALMEYAVDERGQRYVATAVLACKSCQNSAERSDFLLTLAEVWLTQLLFPVRAAGAKRIGTASREQTPTFSETATLIESASRGDQKALRVLLRRRQGEKCAVSDVYGDEAPPALVQGNVQSALVAAHILPFSLNEFNHRKNSSVKKAAITWDMLGAWASFDISKLAGMKINGPANALLLRADLDQLFEAFKWWFEPTGQPNTYTVCSKSRNVGFNGNFVTFVNCDDEYIDVPDPEILALHAAFARVLYASGAAEYIDTSWRDMDMIHVLSPSGTADAHLLSVALQKLITV